MPAKALENASSTSCEKCSVLLIDQDTIETEVDEYSYLPLNHHRTDNLPDLPLLKASAAARCAICAALRRAILDNRIIFSGAIRYNLSYNIDIEAVGVFA